MRNAYHLNIKIDFENQENLDEFHQEFLKFIKDFQLRNFFEIEDFMKIYKKYGRSTIRN